MPAIPSACQALADQAAALAAQYAERANEASTLVGEEAWAALASLGALRDQLAQARSALDECVRTHSAALTGTVAVLDAGIGISDAARTATLWDVSNEGAVARQSATVQAGAFGFAGPLPARAAITLQPSASPQTTGLDFRSGELASPLAGQTPRIEIAVLPELTILSDEVREWATSFQQISQSLAAGPASIQATLTALTVTFSSGALTASVTGSLTGTLAGTVPIPSNPFAASVSLVLVPSVAPQSAEVVSVSLAGANPISLAAPGIIGAAFASLSSLVSPFVGESIRTSVASWIEETLPQRVATRLALSQLPAGTRVSLRRLSIEQGGITLQPVVGAFGTTLSTFKPEPLPADAPPAPPRPPPADGASPAKLVSFTLDPDTISAQNGPNVITLTVTVAAPATSDLNIEIWSHGAPAPEFTIEVPTGSATAQAKWQLAPEQQPLGLPVGDFVFDARIGESTESATLHVQQ
jgi:hypothetical protein